MAILIFDYDGVIVDSLGVYSKLLPSLCKKYGYPQISTKDDFLSLFNNNLYESLEIKGVPKEIIIKIIDNIKLDSNEQKKLKLFRGIKEMLNQLSKNNQMFIITNSITSVVYENLKFNNINYFEDVFGADKETSKVRKIEKIKSKYGNHEYFYIGDTIGDMIEGKKAGVKVIAVTWGWHSEDSLKKENPNFIAHTTNELAELFKK